LAKNKNLLEKKTEVINHKVLINIIFTLCIYFFQKLMFCVETRDVNVFKNINKLIYEKSF